MKIKLFEITVKDIANGYIDNDEEGVLGYGGRLFSGSLFIKTSKEMK